MTDANVQPAEPTDQPEAPVRPIKPAAQLERGDWIAAGPYTDQIDGTDDAEVLHVHRYGNKVAVTIQEATIQEPEIIRLFAEGEIALLTAEEIAEVERKVARGRLVDDLRAFTSLVAKGLPFPEQLHISVCVDTRAEVSALATGLGVETGPWLKTGLSVRWPADRKSYESGFQFMAYTAETREVPEHYETRGWKGEGPGSCGVECACGIGYGGFDSLVEAGAVLDAHIAEANAEPLVHYRFGMHDTACGLKPGEVPAATADHAKVTCKACIAELPF